MQTEAFQRIKWAQDSCVYQIVAFVTFWFGRLVYCLLTFHWVWATRCYVDCSENKCKCKTCLDCHINSGYDCTQHAKCGYVRADHDEYRYCGYDKKNGHCSCQTEKRRKKIWCCTLYDYKWNCINSCDSISAFLLCFTVYALLYSWTQNENATTTRYALVTAYSLLCFGSFMLFIPHVDLLLRLFFYCCFDYNNEQQKSQQTKLSQQQQAHGQRERIQSTEYPEAKIENQDQKQDLDENVFFLKFLPCAICQITFVRVLFLFS